MRIELSLNDVRRISSKYLEERHRIESWEIQKIFMDEDGLDAIVIVNAAFADQKKDYHLSIFLAFEFLSQLMIIYAHKWAGYVEKTQEAWVTETAFRSKKAIRDVSHIEIRIQRKTIRKIGANLYYNLTFHARDRFGGSIEGEISGVIS